MNTGQISTKQVESVLWIAADRFRNIEADIGSEHPDTVRHDLSSN